MTEHKPTGIEGREVRVKITRADMAKAMLGHRPGLDEIARTMRLSFTAAAEEAARALARPLRELSGRIGEED